MSIFDSFSIFKSLNANIVNSIKLFYIPTIEKLFCITFDDIVYEINSSDNSTTLLKELCGKQIFKFVSSCVPDAHYFALSLTGKTYCWGNNFYGQFGNGSVTSSDKPITLNITGVNHIIDISCGAEHTLFLTSLKRVYCCGKNSNGQCGTDSDEQQLVPTIPFTLRDIKISAISCGYYHSAALSDKGLVYVWGDNRSCQLGLSSTTNQHIVPVPVYLTKIQNDLPFIEKVECGQRGTLMLSKEGELYYCGEHKTNIYNAPNKISSEKTFTEIAASLHADLYVALDYHKKCFVLTDGNNEIQLKETDQTSIVETFGHSIQVTNKTEKSFASYYFNNFTNEEVIGLGGFSTVFKTYHKGLKKIFAVKKISLENENIDKFWRELAVLTQLKSDFVIEYINSWIEKNYFMSGNYKPLKTISFGNPLYDKKRTHLLHIQMEFCPFTLDTAIKEIKSLQTKSNKLSLIGYFIASELLFEILECVSYLHSQNPAIIHRDLKPENILLTDFVNNRFVRLSDFGLSTFHEFNEQSQTKNIGTTYYKAPEASQSKYNTKVDMFSIGRIIQDLFHFNEVDEFGSFLQIYMQYIVNLVDNLIFSKPVDRKCCDEILEEKHLWRLNIDKIIFDHTIDEICNSEEKAPSLQNNFVRFFIQKKFEIFNIDQSKNASTLNISSTDQNVTSLLIKQQNKYLTFEEIEEIGSGNFSTVFKSIKKPENKVCAIKMICLDKTKLHTVIQDIEIFNKLDTRIVAEHHDLWLENNYHTKINDFNLPLILHIRMELYPLSLKDVKIILNDCNSRHSLSFIRFFISSELLKEILHCALYLHSQNPEIIHGNLKPENIHLTNIVDNKMVKLSDFCVAKLYHKDNETITKFRKAKSYQAPEVTRTAVLTTKVDMYSLGLIMQDLFDLNINNPLETFYDPSLYSIIEQIAKVISKSISGIASERPNCEQILEESKQWTLNENDITNNKYFYDILSKNKMSSLNKENFIEYFVQHKFKYDVAIQKIAKEPEIYKDDNVKIKTAGINDSNIEHLLESRREYIINNIIQAIDFVKLIQFFGMFRFRLIFPRYPPPFDNLIKSDELKKEFVDYCLKVKKKEFLGLLLHSGQYTAAQIIEPTTADIIDATKLNPNGGRVTSKCPYLDLDPTQDNMVRSDDSHSMSNQFPMSKTPRGICLIINNYLTFGTFKETQRFRNIFYQLHFDVIVEKNLTAEKIMEKLFNLSRDRALVNHDAFACLIISHGTEKGEIIGFDGEPLDMKEMCQIFDDKNCPNLKRKPRIFMFNCCRGDQDIEYTEPKLAKKYTSSPQIIPQLPKILDFLICYSTLDGYAAYVDWDKGTKFGSVLCDSIVRRAWTRDMNNILIRTNNTLRDAQPFDWTQSFTQVLSFNPSTPTIKELPSV